MTVRVVTGKKPYLMRRHSDMFRSQFWKVIKIKEWSDGTATYVFDWQGE